MTEPNEPLKGLIIPNTGDQVGSWGTASVNPNFTAIGGMFGGFQTFSLSGGTTIALTGPSGSITPGAGPTQQQNALLRFTGTQTGTATITFTLPGQYIIDNQCLGTTFPLIMAPASGTGTQVGIPFGKKTTIFFDGTNVDFVNFPEPGTAYDLHAAYPVWMAACTRLPYLVKDGSIWNVAAFPALGALLGSIFGGNGVTTFGLPDERNRMRLPLDTNGPGSFSNRVTSGGSGINGQAFNASGGNELLQSHTHTGTSTVTDPGHQHTLPAASGANAGLQPVNANSGSRVDIASGTASTGISVSTVIGTTGSGGSQNMPPTIVSFLPLIKT